MIKRFAELNFQLLVVMLLAGFVAQMVGLASPTVLSTLVPSGEAFLMEAGFSSYQPDQSSDPAITGVVSRKCHLVIVSSRFLRSGKEILTPFQIPLLETGRGLGGCGEN
jgi:hypothetical protein